MQDNKKLKQVYKYWISKADNLLHKEIAYISYSKVDSKPIYIIYDSSYKVQGDIKKVDFEENMLKRTAAQPIYFFKENDELAIKHFKWALNEKVKDLEEQLKKYKSIAKDIENQTSIKEG